MTDIEQSFNDTLQKLVRNYQLAEQSLTEKQLVEAIRQSLVCGDFIKYVRVQDGGQNIVYLPYSNEMYLRAKIDGLEMEVKELKTRLGD